jgi:beta-galactosidase
MKKHYSGLRWLLALSMVLASAPLALAQQHQRLNTGWDFVRQDLGGVWEAVRPVVAGNPESVPLWQAVTLPHCFNARDAVDPDLNYYQGPGWYRTQLAVQNPYPGGRTRLHFEGAGQKTDVYIYTTKVGSHVGGYDEWTVDITDAVAAFQKTEVCQKQFKGKVPLSIRCDNSRDLEMIPSDLSDFNIYGGLYRYLNLEYQPALFAERLAAQAEVAETGTNGTLKLRELAIGRRPQQPGAGGRARARPAGQGRGQLPEHPSRLGRRGGPADPSRA